MPHIRLAVREEIAIDRHPGTDRFDGRLRGPGRPVNVFPRDWPRSSAAARVEKSGQARRMPFVLSAPGAGATIAGPELYRIPTLQNRGAAAAEDFDPFGRPRAIAAGLEGHARDAAVRVAHGDEDP